MCKRAIHVLASIFIFTLYCFASNDVHSTSLAEGIPLYFKNMRLSLEHKQKIAADIHRYRNADNIWDAIRDDFTLPHYEQNPIVQEKIEWYMSNQEYLLRAASRAGPYLYYILQEIKKRHLPTELALLPIVESGYNPFSLSNVGAAGIWQLMPNTATGFGVKQDWWYDGRRDVIASTRAALNYLVYLQDFFEGNWLLAIAAYNTGEGNVLAAIKKNIRDRKRTSFWSLPLAQQTKDYVPSVLALATIISNPDEYPIFFPPIKNAPYLAQVDVGVQINLKFAAALAGISYKKLMQLNPGFNRIATSKRGPYKLILPIENVEQFAENIAMTSLNSKQLRWMHYKVKTGDTLLGISKRFNIATEALRQTNHLTTNRIHPGSDLLIPNTITAKPEPALELLVLAEKRKAKFIKKITRESFETKLRSKYVLQPGDTVYMTRASDNVEKISKRFNVNPQLLQAINNIKSGKVQPGKQLIIPTHAVMVAVGSTPKKLAKDTVYLVKHGDTIDKIAKQFRTTSSEIRLANLMTNNLLQEGDRITIPTHIRS